MTIKKMILKKDISMIYKAVIPDRLPSLNEYTAACRGCKFTGAKLKKQTEILCMYGLKRLPKNQFKRISISFLWVEKNRRRDKDNICFAKKYILDAMQKMEILENDGWEQIACFSDAFAIDKARPRVEVSIVEVTE